MRKILSPELELPDSAEVFHMNPIWQVLATSPQFRLFHKERSASSRRFNVGELLKAERKAGLANPVSRSLFGLDSQVVLGCVAKGRSASPSLNRELERNVPYSLGLELYSDLCYFETKFNPADDPTRGRAIRPSSSPFRSWWHGLKNGYFPAFDMWCSAVGLDAGLLNLGELLGPTVSSPFSSAPQFLAEPIEQTDIKLEERRGLTSSCSLVEDYSDSQLCWRFRPP